MAGGQVCLLVPSRVDLGEKAVRRRATPRCLFGPPDPAETERLLREQIQRERERFQRRWGVDLDLLERQLEKTTRKVAPGDVTAEESRVPPLSQDSAPQTKLTQEPLRKSPMPEPRVCRKPCVKFQKRVRVSGGLKRQTYLTEFWRSRRSLGFVFGKSRTRGVSLKVLELETPVEVPARD